MLRNTICREGASSVGGSDRQAAEWRQDLPLKALEQVNVKKKGGRVWKHVGKLVWLVEGTC